MITTLQQARRFKNILIVRAGYSNRSKIGHPLHIPAPLSLKYTQTLLEQEGGYQITLVDQLIDTSPAETLLNVVQQWPAELVIIAIESSAAQEGRRACEKIKALNKDIFIVGVGSDVSEKYPDYLKLTGLFDVIIRGEFELEVCAFLKQLNRAGDVENFRDEYVQQKSGQLFLVDDLDQLPSVSWTRQELARYPILYPLRFQRRVSPGYLSTSRGCPHACTFCSPSIRKSYGRQMRLRSAVKVVDDMASLQAQGVNVITFEDDDFTVSKEHVLSVCGEIVRRGLDVRWICHARIDEVTPDLLRSMKRAGCSLLLFGVESGSQRVVQLLRKMAPKVDWYEKAKHAFSEARKAGIATCAMFMVGNPTETEKDFEQSIDLSFRIRPDLIKVHNYNLYPGSADYAAYKDRDVEPFTQHHYLKPRVNVSHMEDSNLRKAQIKFYKKFIFRPSFVFFHFRDYAFFYLNNWSRSFKFFKEALMFLLGPVR